MGELYGEVNPLTMEWRDGLMAISVRQAVQVHHLYAQCYNHHHRHHREKFNDQTLNSAYK